MKKNLDVRKITIVGVLSSISIVLSMTPLGNIPIGALNITTMHIPVIIGAIVEGPLVGVILGAIFGLTSLIRALTTPTLTNFVLLNPLVSILPRVLIGIIAYFSFKLVLKLSKNEVVSGWISAVLASLINTIGVLGMIYMLYADMYAKAFQELTGGAFKTANVILFGTFVTNGIPEAIVAGFIVSALCAVLYKKKKKG